jgi:hypothetical protein
MHAPEQKLTKEPCAEIGLTLPRTAHEARPDIRHIVGIFPPRQS